MNKKAYRQNGYDCAEDSKNQYVSKLRSEIHVPQRPARLEDYYRKEHEVQHGRIHSSVELLVQANGAFELYRQAQTRTHEDRGRGLWDAVDVVPVELVRQHEGTQETRADGQHHVQSPAVHLVQRVAVVLPLLVQRVHLGVLVDEDFRNQRPGGVEVRHVYVVDLPVAGARRSSAVLDAAGLGV